MHVNATSKNVSTLRIGQVGYSFHFLQLVEEEFGNITHSAFNQRHQWSLCDKALILKLLQSYTTALHLLRTSLSQKCFFVAQSISTKLVQPLQHDHVQGGLVVRVPVSHRSLMLLYLVSNIPESSVKKAHLPAVGVKDFKSWNLNLHWYLVCSSTTPVFLVYPNVDEKVLL